MDQMLSQFDNNIGLVIVLVFLFSVGLGVVEFFHEIVTNKMSKDRIKEMAASVSVFLPATLTKGVVNVIWVGIYFLVHELIPWHIPTNVATAIACILLIDFLYYWEHRLEHEVRLLWTYHSVHHSSSVYNYSTALRVVFTENFTGWIWFLPAVFLGFHPLLVFIAVELLLAYQFWLHTELIGKLGPPGETLHDPLPAPGPSRLRRHLSRQELRRDPVHLGPPVRHPPGRSAPTDLRIDNPARNHESAHRQPRRVHQPLSRRRQRQELERQDTLSARAPRLATPRPDDWRADPIGKPDQESAARRAQATVPVQARRSRAAPIGKPAQDQGWRRDPIGKPDQESTARQASGMVRVQARRSRAAPIGKPVQDQGWRRDPIGKPDQELAARQAQATVRAQVRGAPGRCNRHVSSG